MGGGMDIINYNFLQLLSIIYTYKAQKTKDSSILSTNFSVSIIA